MLKALFLLCCLSGAVATTSSFCGDPTFGPIVWSDEFEEQDLDLSKWSKTCNTIDASNEHECLEPFPTYDPNTNGAECRSALCVPEAVSIREGALRIESRRGADGSWTSGAVKTLWKANWTAANSGAFRMCIRAKLPGGGASEGAGQGVWPAHWLMPEYYADGDPSCNPDKGEMDVMEMVNGDGQLFTTYHYQTVYPSAPCQYPVDHARAYNSIDLSDWSDEWHEYAVERSSTHVAFAVDGEVLVNASDVKLFPEAFYLIINSAIGGSWPGEPDERTVSPTYHFIDSVRVAQRNFASPSY